MKHIFSNPELGFEVELNKYARQANGAAWLKAGKNIVLCTAVAGSEPKEFLGFFPLTVEYRERTSAAGKVPGGFFKREGKLSDEEVLTSRLIDRPIRPLFPHDYFNEVQVISTVHSSDGNFPNSVLAILGSSLALTLSDIPFLGPIGAVQIGKINGRWEFNLAHADQEKSSADIIVAGTQAGICMVEGHCNNASEEELIELLLKAHEIIKKQIDWQLALQKEIGKPKVALKNLYNLDFWQGQIAQHLSYEDVAALFGKAKQLRSEAMDALQDRIIKTFANEIATGAVSTSVLLYVFNLQLKKMIPDVIADRQARIDGRRLDEVRPITSEVGILPCAHGSAVFQRGETQALASITLGSGQDAQKIESLHGGLQEKRFMLHYNFPPFSTGEAKPIRAVGRREIGHGYLAETSFLSVLPDAAKFPYTVRSVVDILESNGSSSMATVCSTTLAFMDAGIPIKQMVSGIAMGLFFDSKGQYHILTDILGEEDALGLMDFKVTGTDDGIMAFQLDIKDKVGLSRELLGRALGQARTARLHILGEMRKLITEPRADLSPLAPRIFSLKISQDKIGAIIGPGGSVIKEIVAKTETQIEIEDDGT
ncbi:polyribonucleotide nucleotidyltransferase, partial [Candidatus Dependentiae bacterium]|nr:polyribonucleotide nucleotidyltransferase [Candidatus Dependentiae bacterium]